MVEAPGAATSGAALVRTDSAGRETREPGYVLTSRLVLRCSDVAKATAWAKGRGLTLERAVPSVKSLSHVWMAQCASVQEAARLAGTAASAPGVASAFVDAQRPIALRSLPTDPLFANQWHLVNTVNTAADLNVEGAWMNGYTGAGVTVCVLEGGWSTTHPDLASHFDAAASQTVGSFSSHGTSCAGLVAASAFNGLGGVGVAYDAGLSLCYYGSAITTANSLAFRNDLNDIKSNSWGPSDIGFVWTNSPEEQAALEDAVQNGRGGLGTIIVWAGGNGRGSIDRTDYDPYASARQVVCVGAVGNADLVASYSEPGASVLVCAPSNPGTGGSGIVTTTGSSSYTSGFGGTSAACPIAAGAIALMLDANPALTWRDVQHILVRSSRRPSPMSATWFLNGAGRWTSDDFGFGAVDASAACAMAAAWTNVAPESQFATPTQVVNQPIPDNQPVSGGGGVSSTVHFSKRMRVEHVQATLTAPHPSVGDVRIVLTSPAGTPSLFATPRFDVSADQYDQYVFTSVRSWDEIAQGDWTLTLSDEAAGNTGTFDQWQLRVFGVAPACVSDWDIDGAVTVADLFAFPGRLVRGFGGQREGGQRRGRRYGRLGPVRLPGRVVRRVPGGGLPVSRAGE